jgi:heme-degrading monooxygenase HmoA
MIARIAETENLPADLDPEYVARHRAFIAAQPGFCGGYHLLDADTGRAFSLTMWESDDALAAAQRATVASPGRASRRFASSTSKPSFDQRAATNAVRHRGHRRDDRQVERLGRNGGGRLR